MNDRRPTAADDPVRAWEGPVLTTAVALGLLLMAVQLWILTVALDLLLGGRDEGLLRLAIVSGVVFAGGLVVLKLLGARTRMRDEP